MHIAFTGRAQLLMKYLSLNISRIFLSLLFSLGLITVRSENKQANLIKNQRMNGPLNAHRISEPSLST